jgi:hypothetical protein
MNGKYMAYMTGTSLLSLNLQHSEERGTISKYMYSKSNNNKCSKEK